MPIKKITVRVPVVKPRRANPAPADEITDRAKRYRAQAQVGENTGCYLCGNPAARDVEHIDGDEGNGEPWNLAWACRACNTLKGRVFKALGLGVPTKQYNPARNAGKPKAEKGAKSLRDWVDAVRVMKGEVAGNVAAAVRTVQATPASRRSDFANQIWAKRREHGE